MKRHKYGAVKTVVDGITFDSKKEAEYYGKLKLLKKAGEIKDFELQPSFLWKMICFDPFDIASENYVKQYKYIADFKVIENDGTVRIIDVKGIQTTEFKRKKKIVEKIYGIKIEIV